ncbi:cadherin-related family member 5 isoform X2 [Osmerus mordax]|uniref:cadherin-related family member 5 isoform X2 n=1 Tax=Osmerus mordax TaxID=8014 RepID=UPI003510BE10
MEKKFSLRSMLSFLLLFWLNKSHAQDICSWTNPSVKENNPVNVVVTTITTSPGVILQLTDPINSNFSLSGSDVIANIVLDYEETKFQRVGILCNMTFSQTMIIFIENMNDNPPVFAQSQYSLSVKELTPVDTSVGTISATDRDDDRLFYTLDPDKAGFKLRGINTADIMVQSVLDYDTVKSVSLTLYVQDTPPGGAPGGGLSFTASATILVTIQDIDNRPPWFQPCTSTVVGTAKICVSHGYSGQVNLTVQEVGALSLQPGPVYAIDGDSGINEEITYSFLSGNEAGIFEINANSGNITMKKPVDLPGPLVLTVLAMQQVDSDKFATATVTLEVVKKSLNLPMFTQPEYEGFISEDAGQGSMVLAGRGSTTPLRVLAADKDFADGVNPDVRYEVLGTTDFSATPQGFILLAKDLSPGTVTIQLRAVDSSNEESSTAPLVVEVTPEGVLGTGGDGYSVVDMVALGVSLAVLLVICMVVIGLLVLHLQKGKAAWRKLSEASIFRSSLGAGSGGAKEGVQYTNEGFQKDDDASSTGSHVPDEVDVRRGSGPGARAVELPQEEVVPRASAPLHALLPDSSSLDGSDPADSEREVKPILTKERRVEEGYKSVWFKEDIDPNAKEEVVIIPNNADRDGDDEESLGGGEEEDDLPRSTPKVFFTNADVDSGLEGQSNQESDDDEIQISDL